jgi:hypothetical protein
MKSVLHNSIAMLSKQMAGFEPGPSVRVADAMSTTQRHQGSAHLFMSVFIKICLNLSLTTYV